VRRAVIVIVCLLGMVLLLQAHTFYTTKITWSKDVSRIAYRSCASCHRPGGSSFSLMTYKEARPWAEAIKQQVLTRRMPPWNAVKGFGEFKDDHGLTQEDLEIFAEWAEGGAPEGNPLYLPPPPDFSVGEPEEQSQATRLAVSGMTVMRHPVEAIGIEPNLVPAAGVLQVVARRPDGAIEPLIWIAKFNVDYKKPYYFRRPLMFPVGTKIEMFPRQGSVVLLVK
jgi:hypothetical protein